MILCSSITSCARRVGLILAGVSLVLAIGAARHAAPPRQFTTANLAPNAPIGVARGLNPGRVVWVHDPHATDWQGPGSGHWWEPTHTSAALVDAMMSRAIRTLAGKNTESEAWSELIRHFNQTHGKGNVGYVPGEKVCIKINLVGCLAGGWGGVDPSSYDLTSMLDYMNTSPQVMLALLRQLVRVVGVQQADISIGDPLALFPNQFYGICAAEFPNVHYVDHNGGTASHPRARAQPSAVRFYWSARPTGVSPDYFPTHYAEAAYFIDLGDLKAHTSAGVTLCAKNHYGTLNRIPNESGYYDLHASLPQYVPGMGHYRALVDLLGSAQTGGKALLYLVDGLYSGVHPIETAPRKWLTAPFNNDWTSSVFASQDPVAIDSVAFDFLWTEWSDYPHMSGAEDYLHEAALADNPPSGTFYDPDHATATVRLASLGTHEHWNDAADRKYSRNLGTGNGIELLAARPQPGDLDNDNDVDQEDFGLFQACLSGTGVAPANPFCQRGDLNFNHDVDAVDLDLFLHCFSGPGVPADSDCAG